MIQEAAASLKNYKSILAPVTLDLGSLSMAHCLELWAIVYFPLDADTTTQVLFV